MTGDGNILLTDTVGKYRTALGEAKKVLLSGGIVAFPTESFYGLAVDINNEKAIKKLFSIKQRETGKPILIILPNEKALGRYTETIPEKAVKLINAFWPGGLTMLFKASREISHLLTADTEKIGVRYSNHPVATALAESIGRPVTGTSANISGQPACTRAEEVFNSLRESVDLILDNGPTQGGKGSTILDVTVDPPVVIREGIISKEDIEKLFSL